MIWILLWLSKCRNKKVVNNMLNEKAEKIKNVLFEKQSRIWKSIEIFILVSLSKSQISVDILKEMEIGIHT